VIAAAGDLQVPGARFRLTDVHGAVRRDLLA
jgi:hypothetical protein